MNYYVEKDVDLLIKKFANDLLINILPKCCLCDGKLTIETCSNDDYDTSFQIICTNNNHCHFKYGEFDHNDLIENTFELIHNLKIKHEDNSYYKMVNKSINSLTYLIYNLQNQKNIFETDKNYKDELEFLNYYIKELSKIETHMKDGITNFLKL